MRTRPKDLGTRIVRHSFTVFGVPAPQGSKRHVGKGILVESSKKVKPWREAVKWTLIEAGSPIIDGPVKLELTFYMARPKGHYGTGRNAGILKPSSPAYPAVRPDLDKLARSTLDGLADGGLFSDDSRIVDLTLAKRYTSEVSRCEVLAEGVGV